MGQRKVSFGHSGFKFRCEMIPFEYDFVCENLAYNDSSFDLAQVNKLYL